MQTKNQDQPKMITIPENTYVNRFTIAAEEELTVGKCYFVLTEQKGSYPKFRMLTAATEEGYTFATLNGDYAETHDPKNIVIVLPQATSDVEYNLSRSKARNLLTSKGIPQQHIFFSDTDIHITIPATINNLRIIFGKSYSYIHFTEEQAEDLASRYFDAVRAINS